MGKLGEIREQRRNPEPGCIWWRWWKEWTGNGENGLGLWTTENGEENQIEAEAAGRSSFRAMLSDYPIK